MEPDPTKIVEKAGFSGRRTSSILKVSWKSAKFPDPELQQQNVVECVKPGEKRNSRRVSFAPVNDVLLFSKDVKNSSPGRTPFQDVTATIADPTLTRGQAGVTGHGSQKIAGMENLLNAPLHDYQQKDNVNFDMRSDFGERTVMFSTHEASMDMTQSHTFNIATDSDVFEEIGFQNNVLPTGMDKRAMPPGDLLSTDETHSHTAKMTGSSILAFAGKKLDFCVEKKNVPTTAQSLDPEFENFLAGLSEPTGPGMDPTITRATPALGLSVEAKNKANPVPPPAPAGIGKPLGLSVEAKNKANPVPPPAPAGIGKPLHNARSSGMFPAAIQPEDELTEAHRGIDDADPFQWLFPSQGMYSDRRVSLTSEIMKSNQQQNTKSMGLPESEDKYLKASPYTHHKVGAGLKDGCKEKTVMFTADEMCMDLTQTHTEHIVFGSEPVDLMSVNTFNPGLKNVPVSHSQAGEPASVPVMLRTKQTGVPSWNQVANTNGSLSLANTQRDHADKENEPLYRNRSLGRSLSGRTICPKDVGIDLTEPQRRSILEGDVSMDITEAGTNFIQEPVPLQQTFTRRATQSNNDDCKDATMTSYRPIQETTGSPDSKGMGTHQQVKCDAEFDFRDKTIRFTADDACMDLTQSHTVSIQRVAHLHSPRNEDNLPVHGEKTMRFSVDDGAMDVTKSHTVNIAFDIKPNLQHLELLPASGEKTVRFTLDDAAMDVTKSHTVNIATVYHMQSCENVDIASAKEEKPVKLTIDESRNHIVTDFKGTSEVSDHPQSRGEQTVRFSADDAAMDVTKSYTVNIATDYMSLQNVHSVPTREDKQIKLTTDQAAEDEARNRIVDVVTDFKGTSEVSDHLPSSEEQTVRFTADNASMDVTKSHTVSIATVYNMQPHQNEDSLSPNEEKSVTLAHDYASMDVTRNRHLESGPGFKRTSQSVDHLVNSGEKTVTFTADDAAMDVTKSHTVNIAADCSISDQNVGFVQTREEKPVGLAMQRNAAYAAKDETRNPIVDVATDFTKTSQSVDHLAGSGETTVRFSADDAAMDVTKSHTVNISTGDAGMDATQGLKVNIANNSSSDLLAVHQSVLPAPKNLDSNYCVGKEEADACLTQRERSICLSDGELSKAEATVKPFAQETTDVGDSLTFQCEGTSSGKIQVEKSDVQTELEAPALAFGLMKKSAHEILINCLDNSSNMDLTEAQTGHIMKQTFMNETHQDISLTQSQDFEDSKMVQTAPRRSEVPGPPCSDSVAITNLQGCPDSSDQDTVTELEPSSRTCPVTQNMDISPSAADQDADMVNSRNSRRRSLANLTSKVHRLCHLINTAPDPVATDGCTVPLSSLEHDLEKNSQSKVASAQVDTELKREETESISQDQYFPTEEQVTTPSATPFSLKTKQLMSRLSVGGFKPKLPQRNKSEDSTKEKLAGPVLGCPSASLPKHLSNFDNDVSDIFDEQLESCEDTSEVLAIDGNIEMISEQKNAIEEFDFRKMEKDTCEEDFVSPVQRQKRHFPEDENISDNEKRMKTSTDVAEMGMHRDVADSDGNVITAPTTQTIESSFSNHTASLRCEATFESSYKQSFFESQLEDYANEVQMKLEDGTITVQEFFKVFNIDFVIHNPRQSVCSGRILSETEVTATELLKNRHISRPKQMVYETDVRSLTDNVERLKVRMDDLNKPLKSVNTQLWEEMRRYSEKELKSFGVKLKERNNFFRKTSKVQSHEMKEVLYTNLVQAHLEEQQKLKDRIEKADEMLKCLDDCVQQLQTELAGVEESGFDGKPGMKSLQTEITKATEAQEANERRISDLGMEKKKLERLNVDIQNLEGHMEALETLNEWKIKERRRDCTLYTFLHETMTLQLTYEKSDGRPVENEYERKIAEIRFSFELDEEKSQCHAHLVHKLVSQFTEKESNWVEKFPTSGDVPMLLLDVGLVVSRCRLLGEECQRLKLWGSLPFDILHISCYDTKICIVFSSLKKFSKFKVVFAVRLSNGLCVLNVESFTNVIGSTTMDQIEEIVASFTPAQNLLTKIVKKIHETLLC